MFVLSDELDSTLASLSSKFGSAGNPLNKQKKVAPENTDVAINEKRKYVKTLTTPISMLSNDRVTAKSLPLRVNNISALNEFNPKKKLSNVVNHVNVPRDFRLYISHPTSNKPA